MTLMNTRYLNEKGLEDDGKRKSSSEISHRASTDAKFKVRFISMKALSTAIYHKFTIKYTFVKILN